jgi:hypothetical protein
VLSVTDQPALQWRASPDLVGGFASRRTQLGPQYLDLRRGLGRARNPSGETAREDLDAPDIRRGTRQQKISGENWWR